MISTSDFHTGITIELNEDVYTVINFQHVKPGKGQAFVRSKLKNLKTGSIIEHTFRAGEKMARAHIERKEAEYLYSAEDELFFMDIKTFEQLYLQKEQLGEVLKYLKENMQITILLYKDKVIGVDFPGSVELSVAETDPGVKGNTASGGSKPAVLETGLVVQVPFFINTGDMLKINTRTGEYVERL